MTTAKELIDARLNEAPDKKAVKQQERISKQADKAWSKIKDAMTMVGVLSDMADKAGDAKLKESLLKAVKALNAIAVTVSSSGSR